MFAARFAIEPLADPRLREVDLGAWDGKRWDEIAASDAARYRHWADNWVIQEAPGGESFADLIRRTGSWLSALLGSTRDDDCVLARRARGLDPRPALPCARAAAGARARADGRSRAREPHGLSRRPVRSALHECAALSSSTLSCGRVACDAVRLEWTARSIKDSSMTLSNPQRAGIFAILAIVMAATRVNHFAALPDASWAVFFVAGFYLRGSLRWAFPLLIALAVLIDFIVITGQGMNFWSHYCVSIAYWFLLPAYLSLWFAGSWLRQPLCGSWLCASLDCSRLRCSPRSASAMCFRTAATTGSATPG